MLLAGFATSSLSSLLWEVLWSAAALIGVSALAIVLLRLLARRGIGVPGGREARDTRDSLQLEQRLHLGARQWVYLVRRGKQRFLLGGSEAGGVRLLSELDVDSDAAVKAGEPTKADEETHG